MSENGDQPPPLGRSESPPKATLRARSKTDGAKEIKRKPRKPPPLKADTEGTPSNNSPDERDILSLSGKMFTHEDFKIDARGIGSTPYKEKESTPRKPIADDDGFTLSDLTILDVVGRGGCGIVQKAVTKKGTLVALKVMNVFDEAKRKQLMSELHKLYAADPKYVVQLYDAFYQEGEMYAALEYMHYGSMADILKKVGGLDEEVLVKVTIQILKCLTYLHKDRHQVHRDIKPANLLINENGECKVSDFGIAAQLEDSLGKCATFVGTTTYMSPERLEGAEYSYASDIYSFGLTIVECATGKYPYDTAGGYWGLLKCIKDGPPPTVPDSFSSEMKDFVAQCLTLNTDERATVEQLSEHPWVKTSNGSDITSWLKTVPVLSSRTTPSRPSV